MNTTVKPVSHQEALIYTMVTLSAADRSMTDGELMKIGDIVRTLPIFRGFRPRPAGAGGRGLRNAAPGGGRPRHGPRRSSPTSLPPRLYETAYALAVEVAAVDLHVEQEELRFLQMLRDALDLDR